MKPDTLPYSSLSVISPTTQVIEGTLPRDLSRSAEWNAKNAFERSEQTIANCASCTVNLDALKKRRLRPPIISFNFSEVQSSPLQGQDSMAGSSRQGNRLCRFIVMLVVAVILAHFEGWWVIVGDCVAPGEHSRRAHMQAFR